MKNEKKYYATVILPAFCLCFIIIACSDEDKDSVGISDNDLMQTTNAISKTFGRLDIRVDPRIELINIVEGAKSYEKKQLQEPTMRQETKNYFSAYKDHPAVEMMQKLSAMGFTYTKPRWFMLCCSNPPELRQLYSFKQIYPFSDWIPDDTTLSEFLQKLRDFCNDTKFVEFYYNHQSDYRKLLDTVSADFEKRDYVNLLEDYFGIKKDKYTFVYSPTTPGGFGMWVNAEGKMYVHSILWNGYVPLVLHEFAHCFVNPITEEFVEEVNQYQSLFPPIKNDLPKSYDSWLIAVNEHIIRAFTARVEAILNGDTAGEQALQKEISDGFKYIIPIYERLKEYEANRNKYPDFRAFYPRIIDLFAELLS